MVIQPVSLKTAQEYVREHHRHNKPPVGHKFSIGLFDGERMVGIATAGRPVARALDDGLTLEVTRTCTDGTRNANSMLYGAIVRAATALGYLKCVTYTQGTESGASLRGAGWTAVAEIAPRGGVGHTESASGRYRQRGHFPYSLGTQMLEKDIERYLATRIAALGGKAYKWVSPAHIGVADRIVVLPGGVVWFVEVKTIGGRLSPLQKLFAADMARLGQQYACVWSKEDVDKWMLGLQNTLPTRPTAPKI